MTPACRMCGFLCVRYTALLDYNIDCLKEALEKVFFNENA